jgi:hypothetical protein
MSLIFLRARAETIRRLGLLGPDKRTRVAPVLTIAFTKE